MLSNVEGYPGRKFGQRIVNKNCLKNVCVQVKHKYISVLGSLVAVSHNIRKKLLWFMTIDNVW